MNEPRRPYLPPSVPLPEPSETTAPFWEHCNDRRLMFQGCADCGALTHPPLPACPKCQSLNRTWLDAPDEARVYSFTWVHTAAHESVAAVLPYNVVVVEFPKMPGVRLVSNVVDVERDELRIGEVVRLTWDEGPEGHWRPRFRKSTG
jgi:uncharacterized OB-fold protein